MIEAGNVYEIKENRQKRYLLVLKPEAYPGYTRAVMAKDSEFKQVTCRMNIPISELEGAMLIDRMTEDELSERIRLARKRSSELDALLGRTVTITFFDDSTLTGILEYVEDSPISFGFRKAGYHIGGTGFSKSHVKKIERR